jgi:predicted O-methyltransferase YrrM
MEHFYENIYGWFSYEHIYKDMVEQADDSSLFVEIGSFKGKSTAYMCVEIANSGKDIEFHCIDPMTTTKNYEESIKSHPDLWSDYSVDDFNKRLESVKDYYKLHVMSSSEAVDLYEDRSIDFLLIDGDHSYEGVYDDVRNFLPKMRPGGLIVGDDGYVSEILQAAKDAAIGFDVQLIGIHFFISIPLDEENQ